MKLLLSWKSNKYYIFVCVCVRARAHARSLSLSLECVSACVYLWLQVWVNGLGYVLALVQP